MFFHSATLHCFLLFFSPRIVTYYLLINQNFLEKCLDEEAISSQIYKILIVFYLAHHIEDDVSIIVLTMGENFEENDHA